MAAGTRSYLVGLGRRQTCHSLTPSADSQTSVPLSSTSMSIGGSPPRRTRRTRPHGSRRTCWPWCLRSCSHTTMEQKAPENSDPLLSRSSNSSRLRCCRTHRWPFHHDREDVVDGAGTGRLPQNCSRHAGRLRQCRCRRCPRSGGTREPRDDRSAPPARRIRPVVMQSALLPALNRALNMSMTHSSMASKLHGGGTRSSDASARVEVLRRSCAPDATHR